jgi:sodium transport system permease protein
VSYLAFVAAPPLFMALLVTTRPYIGIGLRVPPWWAWLAALALAVLLFVPGAELTYLTVQSLGIKDQLREYQESLPPSGRHEPAPVAMVLELVAALSLLQAVCEELAFRGFILSGLRRRFRPRAAVFLSSFLFALFHMNVFQFIPHFVLGVVLGTLVLRTGSVFPAMTFHFAYNFLVYACLALGPEVSPRFFAALSYEEVARAPYALPRAILVAVCVLAAAVILGVVAAPLRRGVRRSGDSKVAPAVARGVLSRTNLARQSPS